MMLGFDNCVISISGQGPDNFSKAMSFFFIHKLHTVKMYAVDPKKGMILYWHMSDIVRAKSCATEFTTHVNSLPTPRTSGGGVIQPLPYEMDFEAATHFAWNWLLTPAAGKMRGNVPDHDGDNGPAWLVYNEEWSHVDNDSTALVAIKPIWAMYGK